ncbi:MAG: TonB-dependent receptor [Cyanothece sp. SIO1E1]|nr:TonB-dependent receptor [Cyanothece sp. SIO1E1]
MRKVLLLLFLGGFSISAWAQKPLDVQISIIFDNTTLEEALFLLTDEADVQISFSSDIIPDKHITYHAHQLRISDVLEHLFKNTSLQYVQRDRRIIVYVGEPPPVKRWFTISGFLSDSASLEPLIGATIVDVITQKIAITNSDGFFSLTLPGGPVDLSLSYVGYEAQRIGFELKANQQFQFSLKQSVNMIPEVIVVANDSLSDTPKTGVSEEYINIADINQVPRLGGESDLIRTAYLLPGVQSGTDGVEGMHVRGGEPGQNLILIDGVPVYYTAHAAGLFSIFNSNAISSARLLKGGFPARYGGRTSSVLDIRTRDGNKREFSGGIDIGMLTTRMTFEGPIVKDKSSFIISARKALINWYLKPFSSNIKAANGDDGFTSYDFHDINAKVNYRFSDKDKVYLTYYQGADNFVNEGFAGDTLNLKGPNDLLLSYYFPQRYEERFDWGNRLAAFKWNHVFNNRLLANITASYTNLDVEVNFDERDSVILLNTGAYQHRKYEGIFQSNIEETALRADFDYIPFDRSYVRFGFSGSVRGMANGVVVSQDTVRDNDLGIDILNIQTQEYDVYLENEYQLTDELTINAGLRLSNMHVRGKSYHSLQPRISAHWQVHPKLGFLASASKMTQFLHLLSPSGLGLPSDIWVPSTNLIKPQDTWQGVGGFRMNLKEDISLRVEGYYKRMDNLLTYSEGANFFNNWETNVTQGKGEAYGMEVMLRKTKGRTSGWLAYTLAWSERQFEFVNNGDPFPFKYDRRHDLKTVVAHRVNPWLELTANWTLSSGSRFTFPRGSIPLRVPGTADAEVIEVRIPQFEGKNATSMPLYHRLDVGANMTFKSGNLMHILNVGVYNAYFRQNPLYIRVRSNYSDENNTLTEVPELVQVSLIPITPSLNYSIRF